MSMERSTSVNSGAAEAEPHKRKVRVYRKRVTAKWFLVILAATLLVSALFVSLRGCVLSLFSTEDQQYRPLDIERKYQEVLKFRDEEEKAKGSNSGK
ncbi:MAG TPA: hypothetical protein VMB77_10635 [Syntrophales bacterium]|nr:hypothetical protein [Syntrophales bacterium]